MKRDELKKLLGEVENAGEIIDKIMEINGTDIENAKKPTETLTTDLDNLKAELAKYDVGGEKYVDATEFNRLKQFETDTVGQKTRAEKENAVLELLKSNKASPKAEKLLLKAIALDDLEVADGKIKDGEKIITDLKTDYADFFVTEKIDGVTPAPNPQQQTESDPFLEGFKKG
mgnify:CR=1 FL=1